jgi:hypothetical protein
MRKLLAAFVLVALSSLGIEKATAQIALDGSNHCVAGANNVTSVSCTLPNVSAGDLITVEFSDRNGYMTSIGDGTNGAYSQIYYIADPSDPNSSGMAYFANARAGSLTVSIGLSSPDPWAIVSAQAWTGAARSSVLDTGVTQNQASTSGTVANSTCGTAQTPARAGELILAYLVPDNDSSVTAGTNYSLIDTNLYYGNPTFPEYSIQSAPSATNGAFVNDADDWSEGCAAFKPLGVPGAGIINTVAGNGYYGYSGDGGVATGATVAGAVGVSTDSLGNIYLSDSGNNVLRKVSASTGVITTIAGNGTGGYSGDGGPATSAELSWPAGVTVDAASNVYFADNGGAVRKISASTGIISTVAGTGVWGYSGDGGPATSAQLSYDISVAVDSAGNLYIADKYNMRIRKVSAATGIITTIAGNGTRDTPATAGLRPVPNSIGHSASPLMR